VCLASIVTLPETGKVSFNPKPEEFLSMVTQLSHNLMQKDEHQKAELADRSFPPCV
jgi:hypothetical protein